MYVCIHIYKCICIYIYIKFPRGLLCFSVCFMPRNLFIYPYNKTSTEENRFLLMSSVYIQIFILTGQTGVCADPQRRCCGTQGLDELIGQTGHTPTPRSAQAARGEGLRSEGLSRSCYAYKNS